MKFETLWDGPRRGQGVSMPGGLYERVVEAARRERRTLSGLARVALERYILAEHAELVGGQSNGTGDERQS